MTDAEKVEALTDAMRRILDAGNKGLSDQQLASVAMSYAYHSLQLIGETPHPPLSEEALRYAREVVAPRIAERLEPSPAKVYQVWIEGFAATGQSGPAQYLGSFAAPDFATAVDRCSRVLGHDPQYIDREKLTYWGCRFFDNEAEARKAFG